MLVGQRKPNFFGYGIELLDEEIDEAEDEWDLIEHVRMRGTLDTDTEGSVLGRSLPYGGCHYNSGYGGTAHKYTYEEWLRSDRRTAKEKERDALIEHMRELKRKKDLDRQDREMSDRAMAASNIALRHWHARQETPQRIDYELAQKAEQEEREREHERKRQWSEHTSKIERRITQIVDTIDNANAQDRTMMRAMLRYMNLGPGVGKQWNAHTFALAYTASWRKSIFDMVLLDVERCYLLLKHRHMG